jgi:hypothetical protein
VAVELLSPSVSERDVAKVFHRDCMLIRAPSFQRLVAFGIVAHQRQFCCEVSALEPWALRNGHRSEGNAERISLSTAQGVFCVRMTAIQPAANKSVT